MTKKELEYIAKLLSRIKDPDGHVATALAYVNKNLAQYEARQGQMRDNYETQEYPW